MKKNHINLINIIFKLIKNFIKTKEQLNAK